MSESTVVHDTFTLERVYPAAPARVFAAFADPEIKARWFVGPPDWEDHGSEFDFWVGGRERSAGGPAGGPVLAFECLYQDIVPDRRIVYTYGMRADETLTSISVATIEFVPAESGTRLILTEQGAFLDGLDQPKWRVQGTGDLLDALGTELARQTA